MSGVYDAHTIDITCALSAETRKHLFRIIDAKVSFNSASFLALSSNIGVISAQVLKTRDSLSREHLLKSIRSSSQSRQSTTPRSADETTKEAVIKG